MNEKTDLTPRKENMLQKHQDLPRIAPAVDIYENDNEILLYVCLHAGSYQG